MSEGIDKSTGVSAGGQASPLKQATPKIKNKPTVKPQKEDAFTLAQDPLEQKAGTIEKALSKAIPVSFSFTNSNGKTETITIENKSISNGNETYSIQIGKNKFTFTIPSNGNKGRELTRILDYYTSIPTHLRDAVKRVAIHNGPHPDQGSQNVAGTILGQADTNTGIVNLYNYNSRDGSPISKQLFNHESAHLIGLLVEDKNLIGVDPANHQRLLGSANYPPGWVKAIQADRKAIKTPYGCANIELIKNSSSFEALRMQRDAPKEDFAEAWTLFMEARANQKKLNSFIANYPNRFGILATIHDANAFKKVFQ